MHRRLIKSLKIFNLAGFTLVEVLVTSFILGIFVFSLQKTIANLVILKTISEQDSELYDKTMNIIEYIQSGKGISRYLLTSAEKNRLEQKGIEMSQMSSFIEALGKMKFVRNTTNTIMNRVIKIDNENYQVRVNRKVIEPSPFMFGIEVELSRGGKSARLGAIVSYYDLVN